MTNLHLQHAERPTANRNPHHAELATAVRNHLRAVQLKATANQNLLHAVHHAEAAVISDFKSKADSKVKFCILIFSVELCVNSVNSV